MSFDPKLLLGFQTTERPSALLGRPRAFAVSPALPEISELERVEIRQDVESDDGDVVPAGSVGTVVGVWAGGAAFEVEFTTPFGALATVKREAIAAIPRR